MTSSEIRQSFLDFFKSKQHSIVPSSSLMPDSPNLLFTNAGMNQFVPIFLGETKCPYTPPRAADTQKCIRAGGKHNDLDDVGLDTYHHTFFEMLGNWSFGDYFKKEAIDWAWELITEVWKFPKNRLYATVYSPDKTKGDPSEFDQEAYDFWAAKFTAAGLDPKVHIVYGNKKDNFWMMGETGPCGPCSELHVDLTPQGDTKGALVNKGRAECIEIWNLVFIQFNANPDGTFSPLPARHVDTGMGFERATSIIQCTKKFTDFTGIISNYETDIFRPIFDRLEKMSGKKYNSTLPASMGGTGNLPVPPGNLPGGTGAALHLQDSPNLSGTFPSHSGASVTRATPGAPGATYSKRNLPHFEKPWAIYHVIINTIPARKLSPEARDVVFDCLLNWRESRYRLVAACVLPDHAHFIIQPGVKESDQEGNPVFWPLSEILHSIKSFSAKEVNKLDHVKGTLWQDERFDRYMRSDADLQEKFQYVCRNPWAAGLVKESEPWPWLWTPEIEAWQPYVPLSSRVTKDGTGDPPTGRDDTRAGQLAARLPADAPGHSAGLVAQRDGQVARATQEKLDVAFRVIADHIRTLSFAIADGIQPGNNDRNYVLRRILRRAVRYGRTLGFHEPFFYKLVDVLADTMGHVFPEIRAKKMHVQETIQREEEAFNKTLDEGCEIFDNSLNEMDVIKNFLRTVPSLLGKVRQQVSELPTWPHPKKQEEGVWEGLIMEPITTPKFTQDAFDSLVESQSGASRKVTVSKRIIIEWGKRWKALWEPVSNLFREIERLIQSPNALAAHQKRILSAIVQVEAELPAIEDELSIFSGRVAFKLYDTYGFPLDLTELMARERGLRVDTEGFEKLMEEQRARARAAQKKTVITIQDDVDLVAATKFVGFDKTKISSRVIKIIPQGKNWAVVLEESPFYAEMGGQVGDTGTISNGASLWRVIDTKKAHSTWLHIIEASEPPAIGPVENVEVDIVRRNAIQRHHTVTHLLHWALHEVVSKEASQKGSFVGPDKLTFDFNHAALTPEQVADVEKLVNERILENAGVSWTEVPHSEVKSRQDVMQFFGDKYGEVVRVVQIGGAAHKLDGYSMELCGGTHTRATGEIGLFRIVSENAVAAGVRRIEAVAGLEAYRKATDEVALIKALAGKVNSPVHELDKKVESLLAHQKELEKQLKSLHQKQAAETAKLLVIKAQTIGGVRAIVENLGPVEGDYLQAIADALKGEFQGVVVLGGSANGAVSLVATVSAEFTSKVQAGKIIQTIAPIVGGKGGGKPDNARGGGKDVTKIDEALAKVKAVLAG